MRWPSLKVDIDPAVSLSPGRRVDVGHEHFVTPRLPFEQDAPGGTDVGLSA